MIDIARETKPTRRLTRCVLFIVVVCLLSAPRVSTGETGSLDVFPPPGVASKSGLKLEVDTRWCEGFGYRPVRVTATVVPRGTTPADRVLLVELVQDRSVYRDGTTTVTGYLELPQGSSTATITLPVPIDTSSTLWWIDVYEDGVQLEELTGPLRFGSVPSAPASTVLAIDSRAPSLANRSGNQAAATIQNSANLHLLGATAGTTGIQTLPPGDLPDQWLHYSGIDFVFVSLDDLRQLKQQHPNRFEALRRWCATGPTLCVFGVGTAYESLPELGDLLGVSSADIVEKPGANVSGWRRPDRDIPLAAVYAEDAAAKGLLTDLPASISAGFVMHEFGLGTVVAIAATDLQASGHELWQGLRAEFEDLNSWSVRHGVDADGRNSRFAEWLIPSVEASPATAFRLLITLFVLAIGPVNYIVLSRMNRTYLMLVTAPLASLLAVTILLGYAGVKDGFGVKARVRSLTFLDQRNGLHVNLSRQTYFAAFAPSAGLAYPGDTAVYPLDPEARREVPRRIDWRDGRQRLSEGFLPARETVQFVAVRSTTDAKARIDIRALGAGKPPRVANRLGQRIEQLLVVDASGASWWVEGLDDGETTAASIVPGDAERRLQRLYVENMPEAPDGYRDMSDYPIIVGDDGLLHRFENDPILEQSLSRWLSNRRPPRSYVAIVAESPPGVPLGVDGVSEEASLHIVVGRW
jgi:hypothetical protein